MIDPKEKDEHRNIIKNQKDKYLDLLAEYFAEDLDLFDLNREVEPYKTYLTANKISEIADYYKIPVTDLAAIAEKIAKWNGNIGGVDEKGLYEFSTNNPQGHYDGWHIFDVDLVEDILPKISSIDRLPRAIILPDLTWIDGPYVYAGIEKTPELQEWEAKLKKALELYKADGVVVFIDCHQ